MPIIKSAKKRMVQTKIRQARNYNTRTAVRKSIRRVKDAVKAGDAAATQSALSTAYKVIDTAAKKNVMHKNTAARRKASLARLAVSGKKKKAATA